MKKKKRKKGKRRRRRSRRSTLSLRNSTRPSHCGWGTLMKLHQRNTQSSTKVWQMTGKSIWRSSIFQLRDNWNSGPFCFFRGGHLSIYLRTGKSATTSSFMCVVYLLWTIVRILFQSIWTSLRVSWILKICRWTFLVRCCSRTRSWRWSGKTSSRSVWSCLLKWRKTRTTTRNSTSSLARTLSLASMKTALTVPNLQTF